MDIAKLKQELIRDEGIRFEVYKDTVGLYTIGVGHLLGAEQRMTRITQREAEALLMVDIEDALAIVRKLVPRIDLIGESRQRALCNMAFNLGSRLAGFIHFIGSVNKGDWKTAAVEMLQSKWARQVGKRAERLRDMILTGD